MNPNLEWNGISEMKNGSGSVTGELTGIRKPEAEFLLDETEFLQTNEIVEDYSLERSGDLERCSIHFRDSPFEQDLRIELQKSFFNFDISFQQMQTVTKGSLLSSTLNEGKVSVITDTIWQMNLRSSETMDSEPYPERPGEQDCAYYIRTGLCKFGMTCLLIRSWTSVGANGFLKFPRFLFVLLTSSLPTIIISASAPRKIITTNRLELHQIRSCLYHSSSSPTENSQQISSDSLANFADNWEVELLHAQSIKIGSAKHLHVGNDLLNLYVKCRNLDRARELFDEISNRNVRTWTILISGFAHVGSSRMALDLFAQMLTEGVCPNRFTFSSVLKCCSISTDVRMGKEVHGWILRSGIGLDVVLENSIIDLYVKCGALDYGRRVFGLMAERDTVSWNIIIASYLQIGDTEKSINMFRKLPFKDVVSWNTIIVGQMRNGFNRVALKLLYQMEEIGPEFNKLTYSVALVLVASLSMLDLGRQIHSRVLRVGLHLDGFIRNSLIDMYCKCGKMDKAYIIFEKMSQDSVSMQNSGSMVNTVSWSSIVAGYVQNGWFEEALKLFCKMVREGFDLDQFTSTSIVSACANAGILEQGCQIHAHIEKSGHQLDVFLGSAFVDMYAKCGSLDDARSIFDQTNSQNVVLWTSIISCYALHGKGREAICLFELMVNQRITPNEITFVGVLSGCSHAGLVEEGHLYFRSMQEDYGIMPGVEHFTCMVDLFGRAGRLNEAKEFIHKNGLSHLSAAWRALLSACRVHKNIEMGKWVSKQLLKLEPFDAGPYILLSNICTATHRWEEAAEIRSLMQKRGVRKHPGQSWIQLKNRVHTFVMGDRSHPEAAGIYSYLERLIGRLKEIGYSTDANLVMHDVEEEQREVLLGFHSEKLAIAYGIMSTPYGSPIRVMKNLRVCTDCHTFIKFVSQVSGREIVVRDIHRFHCFKRGQCSCGDYW
ncbi:hypothetical protein HHK36_027252 [Tetracentron sinense]|uniref:DYW domain-containing protein n=1 Tax=Tetracentron sinense TaxID=13715 RepID=A0A835D5D1_TETSI|nr:hypothetical protein HHK36_027252 [Tetracentron sinense]